MDMMDEIGLDGLDAMKQDPEFMAVALQIMRDDMRLAGGYDLPEGPDGALPITAFSAGADQFAPTLGVEAWRAYSEQQSSFKHYQYSGGHYFIEGERRHILGVLSEAIMARSAEASVELRRMSARDASRPVLVLVTGGAVRSEDLQALEHGLPDDIEIITLEPPGQGARAGLPLRRLDALATLLEEELASVRSPVVLFGHFFSAHVCLEIARKRRARGLPVHHLVVSCSMGPARYFMPPWRLPGCERILASEIRAQMREDPRCAQRLDAQLSAAFHHHPGSEMDGCVDVPLTAVVATDDEMVPYASVLAWSRVTSSQFILLEVSGGHMYYHRRPEALRQLLAEKCKQEEPDAGDERPSFVHERSPVTAWLAGRDGSRSA
jgi:surfactin synthase thioesterase subunit